MERAVDLYMNHISLVNPNLKNLNEEAEKNCLTRGNLTMMCHNFLTLMN